MAKIGIITILVYLLSLFQSSLIGLGFSSIFPNIVLDLILSFMMLNLLSENNIFLYSIVSGIFLDSYSTLPIGSSVMAFFVLCFLYRLLEKVLRGGIFIVSIVEFIILYFLYYLFLFFFASAFSLELFFSLEFFSPINIILNILIFSLFTFLILITKKSRREYVFVS